MKNEAQSTGYRTSNVIALAVNALIAIIQVFHSVFVNFSLDFNNNLFFIAQDIQIFIFSSPSFFLSRPLL